MDLRLKRIYEEPASDDGLRVLVDRLWPRGVSRERASIDSWLREIGPSDDLRRWFAHEPTRWETFLERYFAELDERRDLVEALERALRAGRVTLLYSARDTRHNQAVALATYLKGRSRK